MTREIEMHASKITNLEKETGEYRVLTLKIWQNVPERTQKLEELQKDITSEVMLLKLHE